MFSNHTSLKSVFSNKTTRPPRSPVARWSPVLSNSIADIISTEKHKGQSTFEVLNYKLEGEESYRLPHRLRFLHKYAGYSTIMANHNDVAAKDQADSKSREIKGSYLLELLPPLSFPQTPARISTPEAAARPQMCCQIHLPRRSSSGQINARNQAETACSIYDRQTLTTYEHQLQESVDKWMEMQVLDSAIKDKGFGLVEAFFRLSLSYLTVEEKKRRRSERLLV
ncbi:hypothetical protein ACLOJK_040048 [Asimina triloba]